MAVHLKYINRKYPFNNKGSWLKTSLIVAAIVFLLLYLFRPFGLSFYDGSVLGICAVFTLVSFVITFAYGKLLFEPVYRHIKTWKIWHQALSIFFLLIFISFGNVATDILMFHHTFTAYLFFSYLVATLLIGSVITVVITGLSYQQYLKNRLELLLVKDHEQRRGQTIIFHDDSVKGSDFTIPVNDFLYAEVQKNNVSIYYQHNGKVECREMRMTLSALTDSITYPNIIQCHRSFVINIDNITSAKGNSNGYKLMLGNCDNIVPVSRSFVPKLKSFIA